jgi:hypothetical protein
VLLTYILTQTTTRAVENLEEKVAGAGFAVRSTERSLLGGLGLVVASKNEEGD